MGKYALSEYSLRYESLALKIDPPPFKCYNTRMKELLFVIIEDTALAIGIIGILIIFTGSIKALWAYTIEKHYFSEIRIILGKHLILGLDFLVGKDVVDTLLLSPGPEFYQNLWALITIVLIRIIISYVVLKELQEIETVTLPLENSTKKKKK